MTETRGSADGPEPLDRLARAVELYPSFVTSGLSREDFLAQHEDLRDLLEALLDEGGVDSAPDELDTPRFIGDFRIVREIGRGGMGVVYEAIEESLDRRVALKVLPQHLSLTPRQIERFRREASAVAKLQHPGIVPVHSVGEDQGTHWFAMEYIAGRSLAELIEQRPGPSESLGLSSEFGASGEAADVAAQVAEALEFAHAHGVIHRDVKPHNLMIDDSGKARLVDFGLAKDLGSTQLSNTGDFVGTPHYASPEMAEGREIDARSDVFSLGVVLYELLSGQRPFEAESPQLVLRRICESDAAPLRRVNSRIPRDLETIVHKAIEKKPERRYASAGAMAADLRRFLRHEPIEARPLSVWGKSVRLARRHRYLSLTAAMLLVAAAISFAVFKYQDWDKQRLKAKQERERKELIAEQDKERKRLLDDTIKTARSLLVVVRNGLMAWDPRSHATVPAELHNVTESCEKLIEDMPLRMRHDLASLYLQGGIFLTTCGRARESRRYFDRAIELFTESLKLNRAAPINLAAAYQSRSMMHRGKSAPVHIRADLARAEELLTTSIASPELSEFLRGFAWRNLAQTLRRQAAFASVLGLSTSEAKGKLNEARSALAKAPKALESSKIEALIETARARLAYDNGDFAESNKAVRAAKAAVAKLLKANPVHYHFRQIDAQVEAVWSMSLLTQGNPRAAIKSRLRAIEVREAIDRDFPNAIVNRVQLAELERSLGLEHLRGRFPHYAKALKRMLRAKAWIEKSPENKSTLAYATILGYEAFCRGMLGKPKESFDLFVQAREAFAEVLAATPESPSVLRELAGMVSNEGFVRATHKQSGLPFYRDALAKLRRVLKISPRDWMAKQFTHKVLTLSARHHLARREFAEVEAVAGEMVELLPDLPLARSNVAWFLCAMLDGGHRKDDGEWRARSERLAVVHLRRAVELGFPRPDTIQNAQPLARLRGRPDFQALCEEIRAR